MINTSVCSGNSGCIAAPGIGLISQLDLGSCLQIVAYLLCVVTVPCKVSSPQLQVVNTVLKEGSLTLGRRSPQSKRVSVSPQKGVLDCHAGAGCTTVSGLLFPANLHFRTLTLLANVPDLHILILDTQPWVTIHPIQVPLHIFVLLWVGHPFGLFQYVQTHAVALLAVKSACRWLSDMLFKLYINDTACQVESIISLADLQVIPRCDPATEQNRTEQNRITSSNIHPSIQIQQHIWSSSVLLRAMLAVVWDQDTAKAFHERLLRAQHRDAIGSSPLHLSTLT